MGSAASSQVQTVGAGTTKVSEGKQKPEAGTSAVKRMNSRVNIDSVAKDESKPANITATSVKPFQSASLASQPSSQTQQTQEARICQLEKELGESESEKLDLQDRIQALEERLAEVTVAASDSSGAAAGKLFGDEGVASGNKQSGGLQETLRAKDHYIQQLEKQLSSSQGEANKTRIRLKKKIKTLTSQLNEAKQELSITQLELRERDSKTQDNKDQHPVPSMLKSADDEESESKMKVILDLSAQVSEQAEKISKLEKELEERDSEIRSLLEDYSRVGAQAGSVASGTLSHKTGARQDSRSSRSTAQSADRHFDATNSFSDGMGPKTNSVDRPRAPFVNTRSRLPPTGLSLERQSTALSDSDSDWEVDPSASKIHSAPARTRVKSAALGSSGAQGGDTGSAVEEDKWSVITDDNDLIFSAECKKSINGTARKKRTSALKTKLERSRNERSKALMGPSLAFAPPPPDQLADSSCNNTPTPRSASKPFEFAAGKGMSFAV